jgi:hypothetical protein
MSRGRWSLALGGCLLAPGLLSAQAATSPPSCQAAVYHQFDFWAGDWDVTTARGHAGTNSITISQQGCLLHEHWTGARGGTGESFNFYDRTTGRWNQVWVSSTGNVLRLSGSYQNGRMVLEGEVAGPNGPVKQRITWFNNADGTVRQFWETSSDGGATWTSAFDGVYRRR